MRTTTWAPALAGRPSARCPNFSACLDELNVRRFADLDGGWGEAIFHAHLDYF